MEPHPTISTRLDTLFPSTTLLLTVPAAACGKTIPFCDGNGDNMIGAIEATREPGAAGHGLMLVEYRGYGGNPGSPGEAGLYREGEAAMRWLGEAGVEARNGVIVGKSNGSGPATELALRHDCRATNTRAEEDKSALQYRM